MAVASECGLDEHEQENESGFAFLVGRIYKYVAGGLERGVARRWLAS